MIETTLLQLLVCSFSLAGITYSHSANAESASFFSVPAIATQANDPQARAYFSALDALFERLQNSAGTTSTFYLSTDNSVNAFATIDRFQHPIIVVNSGLLRAYKGNMDAIGAVLAHEIGHVYYNHISKGAAAAGTFRLITSIVGLAIDLHQRSDSRASGLGQLGATVAADILENIYTREQEREADRYSVALLARSAINPEAAFQSMQILNQLEAPGTIALFRSHPLTKDRLQIIRNEITANQEIFQDKIKRREATRLTENSKQTFNPEAASAAHSRDARILAEQQRVAASEESALLAAHPNRTSPPGHNQGERESLGSKEASGEECRKLSDFRKTCLRSRPDGSSEVKRCSRIGDEWICATE